MSDQSQIRSSTGNRIPRYFSESFRQKKVREIERNLTSVAAVCREYEVSKSAVYKWIYKYSLFRKRQIRQIIEPMSDTAKIKELQDRIKELERLVGQKQIQLEFKEKMIEIAEEMYKVDIKKSLVQGFPVVRTKPGKMLLELEPDVSGHGYDQAKHTPAKDQGICQKD